MLDVLRFVAKGRRLNFQFRRWVEDYQGRDGVSRIVTVVHWNATMEEELNTGLQ